MKTLFALLLLIGTAAAQQCVSASPETGATAAVTIPFSTAGQHITVYSSIYAGPSATLAITDTTGQAYTPVTRYQSMQTGISQLLDVPVSVELQGQDVVASWLAAEPPAAPIVIVCLLPTGTLTHSQGYATGYWATALAVPAHAWMAATFEMCVAAGDTPMSNWQSNWTIPDGATTDHAACAFLTTDGPYFGGGWMSWDGPGFKTYGLSAGWYK